MYCDYMRNINPMFTDDEFDEIEKIKNKTGLGWHDFVLRAAHALNAGGE